MSDAVRRLSERFRISPQEAEAALRAGNYDEFAAAAILMSRYSGGQNVQHYSTFRPKRDERPLSEDSMAQFLSGIGKKISDGFEAVLHARLLIVRKGGRKIRIPLIAAIVAMLLITPMCVAVICFLMIDGYEFIVDQ